MRILFNSVMYYYFFDFASFSLLSSMSDLTTYDNDPILGKPAPSLESLKLVRGEQSDLSGVVCLLIWAKFDKGVSPICLDTFQAYHTKYPHFRFVGVSVDPSIDDASRYFEKGAPVSFPVFHDDGKRLKTVIEELLESPALPIPSAYIFRDGRVIWAEQFSQFINSIDKSTFPKQLQALAAGQPLVSNGNRPEKEVIEEAESADFGALF